MAKSNFDHRKVRRATFKVVNDTLGRVGAYARKVARNSIKKAPKTNKTLDATQVAVKGQFGRTPSKPGQPPYSHEGHLKDSILFAVDRDTQSVTIGPTQYKGHSEGAKALEYGGKVVKKTKINAPKPKGPPRPPASGRQRPVGKNGKPYRYFYSVESREAALKSKGFRRWYKGEEEARQNVEIKKETIQIKKRPFIDPAFEEAKRRLPELFNEAKNKFK